MNVAGFFKIFGLVLAGFVGLFATMIGYLFATGGFNPPYIPPEAIAFEYDSYIIDDDTEIFIYPTPEDATELDVELSVRLGKDTIIKLADTGKMTKPILVEVVKDELLKNVGGVARIRASQGGLLLDETVILVDVPVESFNIQSSNEGNIYVGNVFTVSPTNVYPYNSLNPSNVNFPMQNKVVRYYSSNPDVATVNELTGQVTTLSEGTFTIEARVIKTYNLVETQPNPLDFEYEEDYWAEMDLISVVSTREFIVSSIAVAGIQANDDQEDPLYDLYLHQTYTFTPSDLGLQLLPQQDSSFTPAQLSYKLKDLTILVSNENVLEVTQLDEPLRYQIRVLNYETWQIQRTRMVFVYEDEYNYFEATVHFKILRNEVVDIEIEKNTPGAIEVLLKEVNSETFDLEANTTITPENLAEAPTYSKLVYKIDLTQARNELNQDIIGYDPLTGYVTNNIITPLNRGTTRLKAIIVQTNILGQAVLDEFGNYIVMFEMPEYVTVNVLEQLTEISPVKFKKPKMTDIAVGDTLVIEATGLNAEQLVLYNENNIHFLVSNPEILQLNSFEIVGNDIRATFSALTIGTVNVFIMNTSSKMYLDYVEVSVSSGTPLVDPILYSFPLNRTLEITLPDQTKVISMIRGTEAFLTFDPNSYGAFVDAYRYGKLIFESANPNMIQIYTSIDLNNNVIVKLVAIGFDLNQENSYSMIRIRLSTAAPNIFLLNQKVLVDLGAVNGIFLDVNSTTIQAIPEVDGTKWLTPEGETLTPTITFSDPDEPAITGVQFSSSDTSILEIDETNLNEEGIPNFIFKKGGVVTLTVKSLDEHALPTDPNHPELGAYDFVLLTVEVPPVITNFVYTNSIDSSVDDYTKMLAGEEIDLLQEIDVEGELKPRIQIKRTNGVDYTPLAQFELVQGQGAATLTEVPENTTLLIPRQLKLTTYEIGSAVLVRIRVYTDFGFEAFYDVHIIPDLLSTITYKGGNSPEEVYPPTEGQAYIRLLEVQDGVRRVLITKRDGSPINNLQFSLNNENAATLSQQESGVIIIWQTAVVRELQVRIFIEYASGIPFEIFYDIEILPNIEITLDYSNAVSYNGNLYEEINFASSYDLVLNAKVNAQTIVPNGVDITDSLGYVLLENNPYITINQSGILTIGAIPADQYISIRIYTDYDYYVIYRMKIKV